MKSTVLPKIYILYATPNSNNISLIALDQLTKTEESELLCFELM